MRASTARLTNSPVRLADLQFPQVNRLIHRTRLAFIHLDNLLAYAKRDRDGRIDGYIAAHLPDECVLLFFRKGEALNAASLKSQTDVLRLAQRLEKGAANAYIGVIPSFGDRNLAQVSARLAADEAMHWTVLTQALKDPLPAKALSFGA